jgi:hypothetical protein
MGVGGPFEREVWPITGCSLPAAASASTVRTSSTIAVGMCPPVMWKTVRPVRMYWSWARVFVRASYP